MREYEITIPIAGHAIVVVEADDEESATQKAFENVSMKDIEDWEPLEAFNNGNVCNCPGPWEVEIIDNGEIE